MLTVYHAPLSRSSRILSLLEELGNPAGIRVEEVDIHRRRFNMGAPDPRNPHPEHKVPYLLDEGVGVRETTAIALHLAEMFPDSGLAISADDPQRGAFLAWLFWYAGVMEPVAIAHLSGVTSPDLQADLRGMDEIYARLEDALENGPWLVGGRFTVADLMAHSTFVWAAQLLPESPAIRDWVERCRTRPAALRARARDEAAFARLRAA